MLSRIFGLGTIHFCTIKLKECQNLLKSTSLIGFSIKQLRWCAFAIFLRWEIPEYVMKKIFKCYSVHKTWDAYKTLKRKLHVV